MKILVVGGAGYIGSHVVKALLAAGHQVKVFDNLSTGQRENVLPGAELIVGDICRSEQIAAAMAGQEAVIHLAALKAAGDSMVKPEIYAVNNLSGTINLLNAMAAAGADKIIFSSSAAVYGVPQYLPLDENHPTEPINFYGFTKLEIERLLKWYGQLKGIKFAALRYFNAVGYDAAGEISGLEKNPQNLLPIVMEAVFGRRPAVTVFGTDYETPDGSCIRDYIHVSDLASAHLAALNYLGGAGDNLTVNLGTGRGESVLAVLNKVKEISGREFPVKIGPRRPGDPAELWANSDKAGRILNWRPQFSDLETIVRTTLAAYEKNL